MRSGSQADHPVFPLVITDTIKNAARLSAISPQARRAGLSVGLTLADARARIPDLWVEEADARADMKLLEQIAEDCDRFTPVVVMDGADGLLLDITGCTHLFGGEGELRKAMMGRIARARRAPDPDQYAVGIADGEFVHAPGFAVRSALFDDDVPDPIGHGIDIIAMQIDAMRVAIGDHPAGLGRAQRDPPASAIAHDAKASVAARDGEAEPLIEGLRRVDIVAGKDGGGVVLGHAPDLARSAPPWPPP